MPANFDDLPRLGTGATWLAVGLCVVFWLWIRVRILRERIALRETGEAPPKAMPWLRWLADRRWVLPVLGALAIALVVALALVLTAIPAGAVRSP